MAWPQLKPPCSWEQVSILVQLGFLGFLIFCILRKCVGETSKMKRMKIPLQTTVDVTEANFSIAYKASIICSTLLLLVHFAQLLMLLNGLPTYCKSRLLSLWSHIFEVASSLIAVIVVYRILNHKNKYRKFPWILRAWWVCSFLLSIACTFVDTYFRVTVHGRFGARDYRDLFAVLSSTFLLAVMFLLCTDV